MATDICEISAEDGEPPVNPMTLAEQERRDAVENEIDAALATGRDAYLAVGKGLAEILESRLYRQDYGSFEDYCQDFWGFSESLGRKWADAYRVAQNLKDAVEDMPLFAWNVLVGFHPSHGRVLSRLPAEQQVEAWSVAKEVTESPTAKLLGQVVENFGDEYAKIESMTAPEELDYLQRVERATNDAYIASKAAGWAMMGVKKFNGWLRQYRDAYAEKDPVIERGLAKIREGIAILGEVKPPTTTDK